MLWDQKGYIVVLEARTEVEARGAAKVVDDFKKSQESWSDLQKWYDGACAKRT